MSSVQDEFDGKERHPDSGYRHRAEEAFASICHLNFVEDKDPEGSRIWSRRTVETEGYSFTSKVVLP